MEKKFKFIVSFLYSYLLVLIPLLVVSFWVSGSTNYKLQQNAESAVQERIDQTIQDLNKRYTNYQGSAAYLFAEDRLDQSFWNHNAQRYEAVELLRSVCQYDGSVQMIFLAHDEQEIFSSSGYSAKDTFFRQTLSLTEESIQIANDCLNLRGNRVTPLRGRNGALDGYLMFHFPAFSSVVQESLSVNFLVSFQQLGETLRNISMDCTAYVRLVFPDATEIAYRVDDGVTPLSSFPDENTLRDYTYVQVQAEKLRAAMQVYFNTDDLYRPVHLGQWINSLILAVGLLASTLVSIYLGSMRMRSVRRMYDDQAQDAPKPSRYVGEYAYIGQLVGNLKYEINLLDANLKNYQDTVRRQAMMLILSGAIHDRATANQLLQSCGLEMSEEYFFVGMLDFSATEETWEKIDQALRGEMACRIEGQGRHTLAFLEELPNPDGGQKMRRDVAERLAARAAALGAGAVLIGISQSYQGISMAGLAFREAGECLEANRTQGLSLCCFDDLLGQKPRETLLDFDTLRAFADPLRAGDFPRAGLALEQINGKIGEARCDEATKTYWRYVVLQSMLSALGKKPNEESEKMREAALHIDVHDAQAFAACTERLFREYAAVQTKPSDWKKIVRYIQDRYADPELSAQEVACVAQVNKTHLSTIFKENSGKTYIEYLSWVRLEKARELLVHTDKPVNEIVGLVGYYDHSSFRRKFKAQYGVSVNDFRNQCRGTSEDAPETNEDESDEKQGGA